MVINKLYFIKNYKKIDLESKTTVYFLKTTGKKSCSLKAFVRCGSVFENAQISGISHFVEHMLFQGNLKLGDRFKLNRKIESLPGDINAATSYYQTEYWYDFPVSVFEKGLEYFCQLLFYPSFSNFEKEKLVLLEEIRSDLGENLKTKNTLDITHQMLWNKKPLGLPLGGSLKSIHQIKKSHLIDYYKRFYTPNNIIFSIVGDLEISEIKKVFNKNIPKIESSENPAPLNNSLVLKDLRKKFKWVEHYTSQVELMWSFPLDGLTKEEIAIGQFINYLIDDGFSSILPRNIREDLGLVYTIESNFFQHRDISLLTIYTEISPQNLLKLCQAITQLVQQIIDKGFAIWEVKLHKKRQQARLESLADYPEQLLTKIIEQELNPQISLDTYCKVLKHMTKKQINKMAIKFFDSQNSILVVSGTGTRNVRNKLRQIFKKWLDH